MQKQFEDVAFSLPVGGLSDPFFSGERGRGAACVCGWPGLRVRVARLACAGGPAPHKQGASCLLRN